ncbi:hypothetical protein ES707_14234 [subsurface metagenome]
MPGIFQKVRSILIPEIGLDVEPKFVKEAEISTEFSRTLAHLAAKIGSRSILLRSTTDGRLLVSTGGVAYETYAVENGVAPDAYNAGSTYDFVVAQYVTDFLIETNDATVSWRNAALVYGDNKALPMGAYSIDLVHYGVRIQNRVALAVADYEITTYY